MTRPSAPVFRRHAGWVASAAVLATLFVGVPLALGSWYTIVLVVPVLSVLLWRLLDEERILRRDLPGYAEYTGRVKYRLVPHVW